MFSILKNTVNKKDENEDSHEALNQWQLMWRKFRRNKPAIIGGIVIIIIYTIILFAGFFSPYGLNDRNYSRMYLPTQKLRFFDDGEFNLRPFVYGVKSSRDPETLRETYETDKNKKYPVYFFYNRDESYKLLGLLETRFKFIGVKDGHMHLMGTDRFGRDMFTRILYGGRISLSIGLLGVVISVILGSILGTVSGYYGGLIDMVIQRVVEFLRSFPRIPLWMALAAALPTQWSSIRVYFGIVIILAFLGWTGLCRAIRAKVLSYREEEYIDAARGVGASNWWIMTRHLIPSCLSHIIIVATLRIPSMILGEAALSFLGLGIRPPMTSWGVLLQEAQNVRTIALHPWLFIPAFFIILTILAFNFLGDGLRDAADPFSQ